MDSGTYWTWPSPSGERKIHYMEFGEGSHHLLLIHGYGAYSITWKDLIPVLIKAGKKIWAIDLLGFGYSDKPLDIQYTLELYLEQINAFMQEMHIPQADLIGHSMGGAVALGIAMDYSYRVKSLTLISPMAYPSGLALGLRIGKRFLSLIKLFWGMPFLRIARKYLIVNTEAACTPQKEAEAAEPYFLENGLESALTVLQHFDYDRLANLRRGYSRVKVPVLIIWGKQDPLVPCRHIKFFKRDFPHAEIFLLDHCGHIPQEEYPQEVARSILNFLKI
jgi:pimeloyl-ACP methyl ester carboxylesterase